MAIVVDVSWFWANSLRMQRAADAAALAGVVDLPGNEAGAIDLARAESAKNGFTDGTGGVVVTPWQDPTNSRRLRVTISGPIGTFFARVIGINSFPGFAQAKADYVLPVPMGSPENYYGVFGKIRHPGGGITQVTTNTFNNVTTAWFSAASSKGTTRWTTPREHLHEQRCLGDLGDRQPVPAMGQLRNHPGRHGDEHRRDRSQRRSQQPGRHGHDLHRSSTSCPGTTGGTYTTGSGGVKTTRGARRPRTRTTSMGNATDTWNRSPGRQVTSRTPTSRSAPGRSSRHRDRLPQRDPAPDRPPACPRDVRLHDDDVHLHPGRQRREPIRRGPDASRLLGNDADRGRRVHQRRRLLAVLRHAHQHNNPTSTRPPTTTTPSRCRPARAAARSGSTTPASARSTRMRAPATGTSATPTPRLERDQRVLFAVRHEEHAVRLDGRHVVATSGSHSRT